MPDTSLIWSVGAIYQNKNDEHTCEYKKVPNTAIAAPRALTGWIGVWKMIIEETMTDIRFMVFPMLNVKGEISSNDM